MLASDRELPVSGGPREAGLRPATSSPPSRPPTTPQPHHQPPLRSALAAIRGRTAGLGAEAGRNLPRPLRRNARFRGHPGPAAWLPGPDRRRRLRPADAAARAAARRARPGPGRRPMRSSCRSPTPRSTARWSAGRPEPGGPRRRAGRSGPGAPARRPPGDPGDDAAAAAGCSARLYQFYFRRVLPLDRPTGSRNIRPPIPGYQSRRSRFPSPAELARRIAAQGFTRGALSRCSWAGSARSHVGEHVSGEGQPELHVAPQCSPSTVSTRSPWPSTTSATSSRRSTARRAGARHPPRARPARGRRDRRPRA